MIINKFLTFISCWYIFASYNLVSACSCSQTPVNKTFCDADWVAKVRVEKIKLLTNLDTNQKVYYIYEGPNKLNKTAKKQFITRPWIYTPPEPGICGLLLKTDHVYLLAGKSHEGRFIVVIECDQFAELDSVRESVVTTQTPIQNPELSKTSLHSDDEENLFRWTNISNDLKKLLKTRAFEPCKNN